MWAPQHASSHEVRRRRGALGEAREDAKSGGKGESKRASANVKVVGQEGGERLNGVCRMQKESETKSAHKVYKQEDKSMRKESPTRQSPSFLRATL